MKYQIYISIIFFFLSSFPTFAQELLFELGMWKHQSLNGSIELEGLYRSQENIFRSGQTEKPVTKKFLGQLLLKSKSYIWHPNFLKLNIDLDFNPGTQNEQFLVIPNRSEIRTAEQFRIQSVFFDQRPLSLNAFINYNHHFVNREYTTNVESVNFDFGGGLSFRNPIVPVTVNYVNSDWQQHETQSGRNFYNRRENIRAELNRSFFEGDRHLLGYTYDDYARQYGSGFLVHNMINSWRLQNHIPFVESKKSFWQSLVYFQQQTGSQKFNRLRINENITVDLPASFLISGKYRYADYEKFLLTTRQHHLSGQLEHQLFLSLHSRAYYEYIDLSHFAYHEYINRAEVSFDYKKQIPTGIFSFGYTYRLRNDNRRSGQDIVRIDHERYTLRDNETVLIENPHVDPASVIISDESGSVIYEENIDYILIVRDIYLEIQRLPGGQIADGQSIYVSYTVELLQSYEFDTNTHMLRSSLTLFDRWLHLYFRYHDQDYNNVMMADDKILKTILQHVYGVKISKSFLTLGFEYDNYQSNIIPYKNQRYFLTLSHNFQSVLDASLTGNWRERELLDDHEKQKFADVSGRLIYYLGRRSKIKFEGGYRFQEGRGIDLDLSNIRAEFLTYLRALTFRIGVEIYRRNFSGEIINYNGGYVKVERKF